MPFKGSKTVFAVRPATVALAADRDRPWRWSAIMEVNFILGFASDRFLFDHRN